MWDRIIGHEQVVTMLRRVARTNRVGHAYLFMGQRGIGKRLVARTFAAHILCSHTTSLVPCGICESCRLLAKDLNPDYFELEPAGANFRINQIRELNTACLMKPTTSVRRVYLLHNVERLTADAANSFLRTLEEPPQHVVFIMLADTPDILETIISRSQVLRFAALTEQQTLDVLSRTELNVEQSKVEFAAKYALGSPGVAFEMLSHSQEIIELASQLAPAWLDLSIEDKLVWLKRLEEEREHLGAVVEYLSVWVRDVMLTKLGLSDLVVFNHKGELIQHAKSRDLAYLLAKWQGLVSLQTKLRSNVNRKLVIDELLLVL